MDTSSTPYLRALCGFALSRGFRITATTNGRHNFGSLHLRGRAIDVSVRGKTPLAIAAFVMAARAHGFRVLDERRRLLFERIWSGPHLHLEDREGMV